MKYKKYISAVLTGTIVFAGVPVKGSENINNEYIKTIEDYANINETVTSGGAINVYEKTPVETVCYSVPVKMVQAANPKLESMGNAALDGNAFVTVKGGKSIIDINFKSVMYTGLYGHLLKFWTYPIANSMNYNWWNDSTNEIPAEVIKTYMDYGMEYTNGNTSQYEFIKTIRFERNIERENSIFVRISVDAMAGFDQAARIDFDWDNALILEDAVTKPSIIVEKNFAVNSEEIEVKINSGYSDSSTYYTTDGTEPTISSNKYTKPFKISGNDEKVIIKAITARGNNLSEISKAEIEFSQTKKINVPTIIPEKTEAKNGEKVKINIEIQDKDAKIYYTTDGTIPDEKSEEYMGTFNVTGNNSTVIVNAVAIDNNIKSETGTAKIKFVSGSGSSSSGSISDTNDIEDGKYWMNFNLWNANIDQASMGDCAFNNNRKALVTVRGNTAKIEMAANPVSVSGYTSAIQNIKSSEVGIEVESKSNFITNTRYDGTEHKIDYITKFSFNLSELNKEYVNVEIEVPYTPMDGISAGAEGYISARLKLDWSTLERAETNDKLNVDSTMVSGSSSSENSSGSPVNYINEDMGIKINADSYILPDDIDFDIKVIKSGTTYDLADGLIDGNFIFYSITAKNETNGDNISPNGTVDIYFPMLNGDADVHIYRVTEGDKNIDGGITELEYRISDDKEYYIVTVKEFGLFVIAEKQKGAENFAYKTINNEENIIINDKVQASDFNDIKGHWAEEYIIKATELGLFKGVSKNEFAPNAPVTKAMLITVLGRLREKTESNSENSKFKDVNKSDYFFPFVAWAIENNIVKSTNDAIFNPDKNITREELAIILHNFIKNEKIEIKRYYRIEFSDKESVNFLAENSVMTLAEAGIIRGRKNRVFAPKSIATRADTATMLIRFINEYMS